MTTRYGRILIAVLIIAAMGAAQALPGHTRKPSKKVPPAPPLVWSTNSVIKVLRTDVPAALPVKKIAIYAARNEYESAQLVIRTSATQLSNVRVTVSDLKTAAGDTIAAANISLLRVGYVYVPNISRQQPDPLPPLTPMAIPANMTQPVWITVYVPKTAAAGEYRGTLNVTANGCSGTTVPFFLTVWNFTLPDTPSSRTAFGLGWCWIEKAYGVTRGTSAFVAIADRHYEMMLQHHLSPYCLPIEINDPNAGKYINDPRLTSFRIPYTDDLRALRKTVDDLRAKGWLSKGYFYPQDEPVNQEQYDRIKTCATILHNIDPALKMVAPFYTVAPDFAGGQTIYDMLSGYLNIWCPITSVYDPVPTHAKQALGEEVWWYVCCGPHDPYPNLFIHKDAIDHRILPWMQKQNDVQGMLYWSVNWWDPTWNLTDPWDDLTSTRQCVDGDGYLFYPGTKVGLNGPVSSIRAECLRDGLEDFDYLTLLEQKIGKTQTKTYISQIVHSLTDYEKDPTTLINLRKQIGQMLSN
jgi:hypothetical protein